MQVYHHEAPAPRALDLVDGIGELSLLLVFVAERPRRQCAEPRQIRFRPAAIQVSPNEAQPGSGRLPIAGQKDDATTHRDAPVAQLGLDLSYCRDARWLVAVQASHEDHARPR